MLLLLLMDGLLLTCCTPVVASSAFITVVFGDLMIVGAKVRHCTSKNILRELMLTSVFSEHISSVISAAISYKLGQAFKMLIRFLPKQVGIDEIGCRIIPPLQWREQIRRRKRGHMSIRDSSSGRSLTLSDVWMSSAPMSQLWLPEKKHCRIESLLNFSNTSANFEK